MVIALARPTPRPSACRAPGAAFALSALAIACPTPALAGAANTAGNASRATLAARSWDRAWQNPFMGNVVAAVDRYADIAPQVRSRNKQRMARREYDEIVSIRRGQIAGRQRYDRAIGDMHFGSGSACATVTRARWTAQMHERGLVY